MSNDVSVTALLNAYSIDRYDGSLTNANYQYQGDKKNACNGRQFARYVGGVMSPRRMYLYQYSAQTYWDAMSLRKLFAQFTNTQEGYWASHGAPITLLFETYNETAGKDFWYNTTNKAGTAAEYALSNELRSRVTAFVKTGVPNDYDSDYTGWQSVPRFGSVSDSGFVVLCGNASVGTISFLAAL